MIVVHHSLTISEFEYSISFARSSGPGGQNINKVNSKATLRWAFEKSASVSEDVKKRLRRRHSNKINVEGELILSCQTERTAGRNAANCREALRILILASLQAPKKRIPTKPKRSATLRRLDDKIRAAVRKNRRRISGDD